MTSFLKKLLAKYYIHFNLIDKITAIKKKTISLSSAPVLYALQSVMGGPFWLVSFNTSPLTDLYACFLLFVSLLFISCKPYSFSVELLNMSVEDRIRYSALTHTSYTFTLMEED